MIKARGVLVSMIYSKLLRSRANGAEQSTAFTLMTNDVEKIVDVWWRLLEPWYCILQISICTYLLYRQVGAICCVPILVILCKQNLPYAQSFVLTNCHSDSRSRGFSWLQASPEPRRLVQGHRVEGGPHLPYSGLSAVRQAPGAVTWNGDKSSIETRAGTADIHVVQSEKLCGTHSV